MEKKTPLYQTHVDMGGKIVEFGGFLMPVQYPTGVIAEHMAVREKAGLFDVSHMGELRLKGPDAVANVQKIITADISNMKDGEIKYSMFCNDNGGIIDDFIVYRCAADNYWLVVNAGNREKDAAWVESHLSGDVDYRDEGNDWGQIALQGPKSGDILFNGQSLLGKSTDQIVSTGVTLVPEGRRVFANLTVEENLRIGAYLRKDSIKEDMEEVYKLFPRLKEREWQLAGTLSGGEQQMLAVGRALMAKPKLVMMDEPSLGLAPLVVKGIFEIIKEINKQGITVLLIEQNANMALKTADWAYVMQTGTILMQGEGKELLENEEVKAAYLGKAK